MQGTTLKITSAVAIDGEICKAGTLVEVTDSVAKNLLHRGKAVLATPEDLAAAGIQPPEPEAEPEKPEPKGKGKAKAKPEGDGEQPAE